jgi:hypothetical protein
VSGSEREEIGKRIATFKANQQRFIALLRQLDHVHRWRISAFLARPAFQCGFQFPDWDITRSAYGIERDARAGLAAVAFNFEPAVSAVEALRDGRGGLCGPAIAFHLPCFGLGAVGLTGGFLCGFSGAPGADLRP